MPPSSHALLESLPSTLNLDDLVTSLSNIMGRSDAVSALDLTVRKGLAASAFVFSEESYHVRSLTTLLEDRPHRES